MERLHTTVIIEIKIINLYCQIKVTSIYDDTFSVIVHPLSVNMYKILIHFFINVVHHSLKIHDCQNMS